MNGNKAQAIASGKINADQGDFFFAKVRLSDGNIYERPIFIVGKNNDSNDTEDILVCSCTKNTGRNGTYEIPVSLKRPTSVRTNKIYTMGRNQLLNKLTHNESPQKIIDIVKKCVEAVSPK